MSDCICGNCKHYDSDCTYCALMGEYGVREDDTCDDWTDDDEPEPTEDERYDGGVMSNFDNENPKEVEDYINEGREIG